MPSNSRRIVYKSTRRKRKSTNRKVSSPDKRRLSDYSYAGSSWFGQRELTKPADELSASHKKILGEFSETEDSSPEDESEPEELTLNEEPICNMWIFDVNLLKIM